MAKNTLHWNDLEEHLNMIKNTIQSRFEELENREKELEAKNNELVGLQTLIDEKVQEVIDKKRECTLIEKRIQERKKKLSWVEQSIEEKLNELNKYCEDVESKSDEIEECERKLRLREESLMCVEKSIDEKLKLAKLKEDEVTVIQESITVYRETLKRKETELDTMLRAIFEGKKNEMYLNPVSSELEEREMQVESLAKDQNGGDGNNAIVSSVASDECTIDISDGRSLQLFMYEQVKRNYVVSNKISLFLQQESSEPAKLVLEAMQGFYPSNVTEENKEFDLLLLRRTCILLLDELYRLPPQISPEVKEEAMKLASDWKAEMKVESENWMEVLGFLRLITTYELACGFDGKELQSLLDIVAQHEQATELSRVLCTTDEEAANNNNCSPLQVEKPESPVAKNEATSSSPNLQITATTTDARHLQGPQTAEFYQACSSAYSSLKCIINDLKRKKRPNEAVGLIYTFKLTEEIPPARMLKTYVDSGERSFRDRSSNTKSLGRTVEIINEHIADLQVVVQCIKDYNLESEYPPEDIESKIAALELLKEQKSAQSTLISEVAQQEQPQKQKASVVELEQQQQQKQQEQKGFKVKHQQKKGKKRGGRFDHQYQQKNKFQRTSVLANRPYQQHQNIYPADYHRRNGHPAQFVRSASGTNYGYGGRHILPQLYPCPPGFGRPL